MKTPSTPAVTKAQSGNSFREILKGVDDAIRQSGSVQQTLDSFQSNIMSGKEIPLRDMMSYQIQASRFGVHVELLSKAVESGMSAMRKLQSGQ